MSTLIFLLLCLAYSYSSLMTHLKHQLFSQATPPSLSLPGEVVMSLLSLPISQCLSLSLLQLF